MSQDGGTDGQAPAVRPLLTVLRGEPTPEQLAALIAVVSSRVAAAAETDPPAPPMWARPVLRTPLSPAPGAWRASALYR